MSKLKFPRFIGKDHNKNEGKKKNDPKLKNPTIGIQFSTEQSLVLCTDLIKQAKALALQDTHCLLSCYRQPNSSVDKPGWSHYCAIREKKSEIWFFSLSSNFCSEDYKSWFTCSCLLFFNSNFMGVWKTFFAFGNRLKEQCLTLNLT